MCGIISVKNLKDNHPVNNLVKILYENQKERGQQGFGFVGLNKERIDIYRATLEEGIMKFLNEEQYDEIIFHHRLPTSTQNTLKSTHPFIIEMESKRYYFMHNGIIQNADTLKENHERNGIVYKSLALELPQSGRSEGKEGVGFNDSEALAWDFCLWLNNKQEKIKAQGSVAFVCLETNKETNWAQKLYFYRNNEASLKIYKDNTLLLLASEGKYPPIKKNWLYFWDYQKRHIRRYKFLEIKNLNLFSFNRYYGYYDYPYFDDEIDEENIKLALLEIKDNIAALEQERDELLSAGRHIEAEAVDEKIDDLKDQLKEMKNFYCL
jgi:hypothetical protein